MKKIVHLSLAITFFLLFSNAVLGNEFNPGKIWLKWSEGERLNWVWGLSKGQELILEELQYKDVSQLKYFIPFKDADTISAIVTQYYKHPSNTYIPWKYMTHIAKMKLEGFSSKIIEEQLELLRKYANFERKKAKTQ